MLITVLESFLLFSQSIPSRNLGFIDPTAGTLEIEVAGLDITFHQSPTILSSNRSKGTTGAVVWKVSPLFAAWIAAPGNLLFNQSVLSEDSIVLELGCGIAGIVALALSPKICTYIATDQDYLMKFLKQNIEENTVRPMAPGPRRNGKKNRVWDDRSSSTSHDIRVVALDWEVDSLSTLPDLVGGSRSIDAVIACDCIYNEALIDPFVRTCAEACQLRAPGYLGDATICIVAQQLRSFDVFEAWAKAFHRLFKFWRLPDEILGEDLRSGSGYVVHLGISRRTSVEETVTT